MKSRVHQLSQFPVVTRLRKLGCCPLSITKIKKGSFDSSYFHVKYTCNFFSFPTFYTIATILIYFLVSVTTIVQDVYFGRYKQLVTTESTEESSFSWPLDCFVFIYYIWLFINPILISTRSKFIVEFMEKTEEFSLKFENTFLGDKCNFSNAKSAIVFTRTCFGLLGLIFLSIITYLYVPCLLQFKGDTVCRTSADRNQAWLAFFGVILGYTVGFYQDSLTICLFSILENLLSEIERGMKNQCNHQLAKHSDMISWVKMGRSVKIQADLFSCIIGPWELGTLLSNFLTWVLLAFMFVNSSIYEPIVLGSASFFCCSNLFRLHLKSISEKRIRIAEKRILQLLIQLQPSDFIAETERLLLASAMACRPIHFNLCQLIPLDSRLTVWLIGEVVTYLMVLLQFQDLKTNG